MRFRTHFAAISTSIALLGTLCSALPQAAHAARPPTQDSVDNSIDDKVNEAMGKLRGETVPRSAYLEDRKMFIESLEKSEPLAALLSGIIGFGSGSFYAGDDSMGYTFLSCELGIIGLIAASTTLTSGTTVLQAESLLFIAFRVADLILGTVDASNFNDELHRRAQIGQIKMGQLTAPTSAPPSPSVSVSLLTMHF